MRWCTGLILAAGTRLLPAADLEESAWAIGLERLPNPYDYRLSAPNGAFTGKLSSETEALVAGWRGTFAQPGWSHGPIVLAEGAVLRGSFSGGDFTAAEGRSGLGWAYALDRRWTGWTYAQATYGLGQLSVSEPSLGSQTYRGRGWSWMLGLGGSWAMSDSWSFTAHAGWRDERWDLSGHGNTIRLSAAGPTIGLGFEWRPAASPRRLE